MNTVEARVEVELRGRVGSFGIDATIASPMFGITALYGPSGCGKTTLLRAVAGLSRLSGRVSVGGETWQDDDSGRFLPTHERSIGYVFQEPSLFPHLSVERNLAYGLRRVPAAERRVELSEAADLLGVTPLLNRGPDTLSGGQRQRVAIARALLTSPRLLLMDEPLAALDKRSRDEILPYLERLHEELRMPVWYVSHAPEEVARLADHLVLLDEGRVKAAGPIAELTTRLDLASDAGNEAGVVIDARVAEHDADYPLSYLEAPGARFVVARVARPIGAPLRLRVLARDVSLTLQPPGATSILNIFPARVQQLVADATAQVLVRLDLGDTVLLARVTRKSTDLLGLHEGQAVFVQIKAVALFP
jgi:molybdate transport system ATP-binding protein